MKNLRQYLPLQKKIVPNLLVPNLLAPTLLVLVGMLSTLANPTLAQAQTKRFGLLLGAEGVLSLPLSDRSEGQQTKDNIGIAGRVGLQAGVLYRDLALVARTRVGGSTLFPSPPDLTFDLYMTYTLPIRVFKPWLGLGYSALFPSLEGILPNRPHPYHGALLVAGNRWSKGFYSEYAVGYYPYSAASIRENLVDISVSIGYRHIFRF